MKTALVTGGTAGIGDVTARILKEKGYNVVCNNVFDDEATAKFKEETGIPVYIWDVTDFDACQKGVDQIIADHGGIDVLVNNAGIIRDAMLHKMDQDKWSSVIDVNLNAAFNMCKAVIEHMREKKYGRIINIGSVNGLQGQMGQTNYAATKAGIIGFSKSLAKETARKGITVNVVAPGYVNTAMMRDIPEEILSKIIASVPIGRLAEPEEIGEAVAYLAGDSTGAFITGATLNINGGLYVQ